MNDILLLGIILSLIYTEFTDLSPGGIIVPAYFAMYSYDWKRLAGTVLLALICVAVVHFLSKYMILNFHEHTVTARYSAGGKQRTVEAIRKAQEAGQIRNLCDPEKLLMALKNLSLGLTLKWIMTKGSFPFFSHYGRMVEDIILPDYDAVLKQTGVDHRKKTG